MSESEPVEGVTLCNERADLCVCVKPLDHMEKGDDVHECDEDTCGGAWKGTFDPDPDPDVETYFDVVRYPDPARALMKMLGIEDDEEDDE